MGRIVLFLGTKGGVGTTSLVETLGWKLSRHYKVCLFDACFGYNDLSYRVNNNSMIDLKEMLFENANLSMIKNFIDENKNLCVIRTNGNIDYLNYESEIVKIIKKLSNEFNYMIFDVNAFDKKIMNFLIKVVNEVYIVLNDSEPSIRNCARLYKNIGLKRNIQNIKLILNKAKIYKMSTKKSFSVGEIEKILDIEIGCVIPLFYKYNYFESRKKYGKWSYFINNFVSYFISNRSKNFIVQDGILNYLKGKLYEKFN